MPPATLSLIFFIIEEAIKLEPGIATELKGLFSAGEVTPDLLASLRAKIAAETYESFAPAIPAGDTVPVTVLPDPAPPAPAAAVPEAAAEAPVVPKCVNCGQGIDPTSAHNCIV